MSLQPTIKNSIIILILVSLASSTLTSSSQYTYVAEPISMIMQQPSIVEYSIPTKDSGPYAIATGPNQMLWFTEFSSGKLASINIVNGTIHETLIPQSGGAIPVGIAIDPRGQIWVADQSHSGAIWRYNPSDKTFARYDIGTQASTPFDVLVDRSNNTWFTELTGNKIGEILYGSSSILEYQLPSPVSGPAQLAIQNGTSFLWITENYGNKIARFDTASKSFQEFNAFPALRTPLGVSLDNSGNVWVSEHGGSSIAQFVISNSTFRRYPTATGTNNVTAPATVNVDPSGRVWFVEHASNKVGRLNPVLGTAEEFLFPSSGFSLQGFGSTLDPAANFWFTQFSSNAIGMIASTAKTGLGIRNLDKTVVTLTAGSSRTSSFVISNDLSTTVTIRMNPTSTFSVGSLTDQVTLSDSTLTLGPKENRTITATIAPDSLEPPGLYAAGAVATYGNASTIGSISMQVQPSIYYQLQRYLPEIIILIIAAAALTGFLIFRRRSIRSAAVRKVGSTAPAFAVAVAFFLIVTEIVVPVSGKCPGLPPPPVSPTGGMQLDYFGLALDLASTAFFGLIAYLLIRDRRRKAKKPVLPPSPS